MDAKYYTEYFKKYADLTEEDAIRVKRGAIVMDIVDSVTDDPNDRVAHQASIILDFNMYRNDKDAYMQEVCYNVSTADCEIEKVVSRCRDIIQCNLSDELEDDISVISNILIMDPREQNDSKSLGYICEDMQRSFIVHEKPAYDQLSSNIDYILYDLLDVLDLSTGKCKDYVYKHREQFIHPIMDLTIRSGDIILMGQMNQIYTNWIEWR